MDFSVETIEKSVPVTPIPFHSMLQGSPAIPVCPSLSLSLSHHSTASIIHGTHTPSPNGLKIENFFIRTKRKRNEIPHLSRKCSIESKPKQNSYQKNKCKATHTQNTQNKHNKMRHIEYFMILLFYFHVLFSFSLFLSLSSHCRRSLSYWTKTEDSNNNNSHQRQSKG